MAVSRIGEQLDDTCEGNDIADQDITPENLSKKPDILDNRALGSFESHYSWAAWIHIIIEFAYLLSALAVCGLALVLLGRDATASAATGQKVLTLFIFSFPEHREILIWVSMSLSAACGGVVFALKWLYHSVAQKIWHHDRTLWRFTVPVISATLAPFIGAMIGSGLVPFFNERTFTSLSAASGFGFFIGLVSDNVVAALQRLAQRVFGTVSGGRTTDENATMLNEQK